MGARIDLADQVFGRLTVIRQTSTAYKKELIWLCSCECGSVVSVRSAALRNGTTKSCGCSQKDIVSQRGLKDITGQRFERLLVLEKSDRKNKARAPYWKCLCDCGNEVYVVGTTLRDGRTKSCGCLQRELASSAMRGNKYAEGKGEASRLPYGEACINALEQRYIAGATERGYVYELPRELFSKLIFQTCHYCGVEPFCVFHKNNFHDGLTYNGIDRKNNKLGYTIANCVTCCKTCNKAKGSLSYSVFVEWLDKIAKHRPKEVMSNPQ